MLADPLIFGTELSCLFHSCLPLVTSGIKSPEDPAHSHLLRTETSIPGWKFFYLKGLEEVRVLDHPLQTKTCHKVSLGRSCFVAHSCNTTRQILHVHLEKIGLRGAC